jgi:hypothetical protein
MKIECKTIAYFRVCSDMSAGSSRFRLLKYFLPWLTKIPKYYKKTIDMVVIKCIVIPNSQPNIGAGNVKCPPDNWRFNEIETPICYHIEIRQPPPAPAGLHRLPLACRVGYQSAKLGVWPRLTICRLKTNTAILGMPMPITV